MLDINSRAFHCVKLGMTVTLDEHCKHCSDHACAFEQFNFTPEVIEAATDRIFGGNCLASHPTLTHRQKKAAILFITKGLKWDGVFETFDQEELAMLHGVSVTTIKRRYYESVDDSKDDRKLPFASRLNH